MVGPDTSGIERWTVWRASWRGRQMTKMRSEDGRLRMENFADELRRQRRSMKWAGGNAGRGGDRRGVEGRGRKGDPEMVGKDGEQVMDS